MTITKDGLQVLERIDRFAAVIANHSASVAELARGLKVNGVLYSGTRRFNASGWTVVEATVPFAAATVRGAGSDVTIAAGSGTSSSIPTDGPGVFTLPADVEKTVAVTGNVLVVYGTPNATVAITLWIYAQPPTTSESHPIMCDTTAAGPTRVGGAIASTLLAAANPARRGLLIFNENPLATTLNVAYGPTASATLYTVTVPGGSLHEIPGPPFYRGIVTGIWSAATGAAQVTELI